VKIGLVSSTVPLAQGGGRFIVDWLSTKLVQAGHQVETVWIPYSDEPSQIFPQMTAFRLLDLEGSFDRVITFRPPAHVVRHRAKIVWFIHHIRIFYDMWDTMYCPVPPTPYWQSFRHALMEADTRTLQEARTIFTNSKVVADRVRRFNNLECEVLYPPVFAPERFFNDAWGDEIVCVCRMEHHKRQHLLIEAMRHVRTPVRLRLSGNTMSHPYMGQLKDAVAGFRLEEKVRIDARWVSEEEKISLLAAALASAYIPLDEDSYGYPTIEAAHASKATIATHDGGGVLEFIKDGENGILVPPEPEALAEAFDRLWSDRSLARRLGEAANHRVREMNITWEHVLERLLA
jgi:glycosyltransferase involved in cell wall biosynthesis